MKSIVLTVFSVLILSSNCAFSQSAPAKNTTDKNDPFVTEAERSYQAYLVAEKLGDIEAYKKYRVKSAVEEIVKDQKKRGKSEADLASTLKGFSKYQTSLNGFKFVRAEGSGNSGRLFYRKDWKEKDLGEMNDFFGFVVRLEGGAWKVDCMINSIGTKIAMGNNGKLQERTLSEISEHRCLSLK
jgi:hypothetical protein